MAPITFTCPFCGKRMGILEQQQGKAVRCPHCRQVVLAPPANEAGISSPSASTPPKGTAEPAGVRPVLGSAPFRGPSSEGTAATAPPLPVFSGLNTHGEEAASILSEQSAASESLFEGDEDLPRPILPEGVVRPAAAVTGEGQGGSPGPRVTPLPPARQPVAATPPASPTPAAAGTAAPPQTGPSPTGNPTTGTGTTAGASTPAPDLPASADPGPFRYGNVTEEPTPPLPIPLIIPVSMDAGSGPESPSAPSPPTPRPSPQRAVSRIPPLAFYVLAAYALLATLAAVYGLFFRTTTLPPTHPLAAIPDTFGEYDPASRKKVAVRIPLTGPLPDELLAPLGGTITVGQLRIEPLRVEERPLRLITESTQEKREQLTPPALVLYLKLTNISTDLQFQPVDPALIRKATQLEQQDQFNGTRLQIGRQVFVGGPLEWPFRPGIRRYEAAQAQHHQPLQPGEAREFAICSPADSQLRQALRNAPEQLLWRIHLRTGILHYKDREIPITSIIGVSFSRSDIQKPSS
ncbi:MAG: hypothetical protein NZ703_05265 [Gemmataceae bacterium]|nr:hypothetical protein [Gemmataceae bacterium]MCS7270475.1 hypothetical protein [Gemmataceae bacterium]MDW8242608.1 hypothetical protein [Thermogemmata sp.]